MTNYTAQQWSFQFNISLVNVNKSTGNFELVTFTEKVLKGKLHFLCILKVPTGFIYNYQFHSANLTVSTQRHHFLPEMKLFASMNIFITPYHLKILHATCLRHNPFQIQLFLLFLLQIMRFLKKIC